MLIRPENSFRLSKDVSFGLKKGETLGIVGESGCGKSTLARAILGYCRPGSFIMGGEVLFDGEDILQMSSSQLRDLRGQRIAMVPQNPLSSLTYHMKVGPQVDEILKIHRGMDSKAAHASIPLSCLPEPTCRIPSRFMIATPMRFPVGNGNGW